VKQTNLRMLPDALP